MHFEPHSLKGKVAASIATILIFGVAVVLPIATIGWKSSIFLITVNVIFILMAGDYFRRKDSLERLKRERYKGEGKDDVLSFDLTKK